MKKTMGHQEAKPDEANAKEHPKVISIMVTKSKKDSVGHYKAKPLLP